MANTYIHRLLRAWKKFGLERKLGPRIVNYADDLVIVCRTKAGAREAHAWLEWITRRLGLQLNEQKTCIRDAQEESFDFLGYTFGPKWSYRMGRMYPGVAPSKKAVGQAKQRVRSVLRPGNTAPAFEVVAAVNRHLVGWANYFSVGSLSGAYIAVDFYTNDLLRQFLARRHKTPGRGVRQFHWQYLHQTLGLMSLEDRRQSATSQALK